MKKRTGHVSEDTTLTADQWEIVIANLRAFGRAGMAYGLAHRLTYATHNPDGTITTYLLVGDADDVAAALNT